MGGDVDALDYLNLGIEVSFDPTILPISFGVRSVVTLTSGVNLTGSSASGWQVQ